MLTNIIVFFLLIILTKWLWGRRYLYMISMKLNGPFSIPFFGSIGLGYQLFKTKDAMLVTTEAFKNYSGIHRVWMFQDLFVTVYEPEDVKEILCNAPARSLFTAKPWSESMGNGFLAMANHTKSEYNTWKSHINILIPSVTSNSTKFYYEQMYKASELLVEDMNKISNKELVDIGIVLLRSCADTVFKTLCGTELEFRDGSRDHFLEDLERSCTLIFDKTVNLLYWFRPLYRFTEEYAVEKHVKARLYDFAKELYKLKMPNVSEDKNGLRSIDLLMKAKIENKMTEEEVLTSIIHLWTAGFDTTAITLSHFVQLLAMNKNCQDKAYQEIKNYFNEHDTIEWDDLDKFTYIEMCMKETLRLFPIAPGHFRYAVNDIPLKSQNITIPAGTNVAISTFLRNRDPKYWDEPLKFKPERFIPEEIAKRHPYIYIPFGGGVRKCIGTIYGKVIVKLHIINLLKNFEVHSDWKLEDLKLTFDIDCRVVGGHHVKVTPRKTLID